MKISFRKSFERDLRKVKDRSILRQVRAAVAAVEAAAVLNDLRSIKKISGADDFYRLRVGKYRIGMAVEGSEVVFVRCLHRREIYRHFP